MTLLDPGPGTASAGVGHQAAAEPFTGRVSFRGRQIDQWICWYSIPVFYALFGLIFVVLTRLMPPPSPLKSVAEMGEFISGHRAALQWGVVLLMLAIGFSTLTTGLLVTQMRRMEGVGAWMPYAYLGCLAVAVLPGCLLCGILFGMAAFRPDRDPNVIALLYDAGMISFVGSLGCFAANYLILALAILRDRRGLLPKWIAYWTIWNLITEVVAVPSWFFRTGPFAWNGLLAFYQGTIIWVSWQFMLAVLLFGVIRRQAREATVAA